MEKLEKSNACKPNLYQLLGEMEDHRRPQGRMHRLETILMIALMAVMSGYSSVRAMGDFKKKNSKELLDLFKPKSGRLPSHQTIARVIAAIKFESLLEVFRKWQQPRVKIQEKDSISIDGKAIGGTTTNPHDKYQRYVNLVSAFLNGQKQVLAAKKVNDKGGEIPIFQELVKQLELENVVFSGDALHCQKKQLRSSSKAKMITS